MRSSVRQYTNKRRQLIKLVGILAESSPHRAESEKYSDRISETFLEDGIAYELCKCTGISRSNVEQTIQEVNIRNDVHGILVFYPIFKNRKQKKTYIKSETGVYYKTDDDYLQDIVHPFKDVEGLHNHFHAPRSMFRARLNAAKNFDDYGYPRVSSTMVQDIYIPCTALAVTKILDAYVTSQDDNEGSNTTQTPLLINSMSNRKWLGSTVTIVNRSEVLGRPLAALLSLQGATVFSVDEKSILVFLGGEDCSSKPPRMRRCSPDFTLKQCVRQSSIIVTGVPTLDFRLKSEWIGEGATIVNVSEFPNVDPTTLPSSANYVPSVGKVTVAALEENLIRLHREQCQQQENQQGN